MIEGYLTWNTEMQVDRIEDSVDECSGDTKIMPDGPPWTV